MGERFKLNNSGICQSCNVVGNSTVNLKCFFCKCVFHGACPEMSEEDKAATKSLVEIFDRISTKNNFKFFCDVCLTKFEMDLADSETNRLNMVEDNITTIKSELEEIKELLKNSTTPVTTQGKSKNSNSSMGNNIWFDKARLESTKVAPAEPMLVVNNHQEVNESVEKLVVENNIPVTKNFKDNAGNLVVVCESNDS